MIISVEPGRLNLLCVGHLPGLVVVGFSWTLKAQIREKALTVFGIRQMRLLEVFAWQAAELASVCR